MEILEALFGLADACGCFLEFAAVIVDLCAAIKCKEAYDASKEAEPGRKRRTRTDLLIWLLYFCLLVGLGVVLTGLALARRLARPW